MLSIITFICLIVCITIHEYAHALVADRLGDPTPRSLGRLSLNPLRHLDPLGTLMMIFAGIGWGKPVPFDPYNLRNPRRDEMLIALAGPASNLILAVILSIINNVISGGSLFFVLIVINVSLAVFNLLPIPPLDGSKIFLGLLPTDTANEWDEAFSRYGYFLLAILLFLPMGGSNLISIIIIPIINLIMSILV